MSKPWFRIVLLAAILFLGLGLRAASWGQNRFLEDEALYAYWGLQVATGADPMLDYEPVDKPPLYPYTLATSFLLISPLAPGSLASARETAARLPSLVSSLAGIALVYGLGRELYLNARVGLIAAALVALSPFDILFASTAFTDPLMTAWILAALLLAARGQLGGAGLLAGLAAVTKQQGLFFLPLVAAMGLLSRPGQKWSTWLRFLIGFAAILSCAIGWDALRLQKPGFVLQSILSYGGLRPVEPGSLGTRAAGWIQLLGYFWASPWFNGMIIGALAAWLCGRLAANRLHWSISGSRADALLAAFVGVFLLLHWLFGFQIWDRYLLAIVPLVALLAARALVCLAGALRSLRWQRIYAGAMTSIVLLSLTGPAVQAAHAELPVGGDHGAYDGIDDLATYVRSEVPTGAVLYHYWLGYHYRFYLYGAPLRLHWYPDLEDLAHDATVYRREPRYIAFPTWHDDSSARLALANSGISLVPVFEATRRDDSISFQLYRMEGP